MKQHKAKKINHLRKVLEIQAITIEYLDKGHSEKWIYDNIIKYKYFIALNTYYQYMGINAKQKIKVLLKEN